MDWSFMAAPVTGLLGGLMGQSSAKEAAQKQFENQLFLMDRQHQYNLFDYQQRYKWAANDLRAAGLNPILAATNGIGGSINGVSSGAAAMAQTPDFGSILGNTMSSAIQAGNQKEIAKMHNEVEKGELRLKEFDINSAVQKRMNDIKLENGRFELEKWTAQENIRLKEVMQDAQIKNMVERLQADIEHMARQDANGAVSAAAAMAQANASGLMAAVQERLGISREELNNAQKAYIALQSANAEESLKWQKWLNDHPYTRGAVGFLGAVFDTAGLVSGVSNLGNSLSDMVD